MIAWHARSEDDAVVTLKRLARDGRMSTPVDVAITSPARASGFPRLASTGDGGWLVVWTDADAKRLRAALVSAVPAVAGEQLR